MGAAGCRSSPARVTPHRLLCVCLPSVTGGVTCPSDETRCIATVSMRRMARVKWVDKDNMLACVEAGAIGVWRGRCGACASVVTMVCWTAGSVLAEQLRRRGVTLGHEPDSMEFSTLGGWIATRASGMKKNVYGNIEDIVVNCKLVTPKGAAPLFVHMRTLLASLLTFATARMCACTGTWERGFTAPRVSVGSDSMQLVLGSEGTLGIITEAVVRVRVRVLPWFSCARLSSSHATRAVDVQPLPSVQSYGSIVFPSLEAGVAALRTIAAQRAAPASIRLVDNAQFMFGRAMKPESASPLRDAWFDRAAKALLSVRPTPRPCLARRVDSHCAVLMVTAQGHAPGPCSGSHAGV